MLIVAWNKFHHIFFHAITGKKLNLKKLRFSKPEKCLPCGHGNETVVHRRNKILALTKGFIIVRYFLDFLVARCYLYLQYLP